MCVVLWASFSPSKGWAVWDHLWASLSLVLCVPVFQRHSCHSWHCYPIQQIKLPLQNQIWVCFPLNQNPLPYCFTPLSPTLSPSSNFRFWSFPGDKCACYSVSCNLASHLACTGLSIDLDKPWKPQVMITWLQPPNSLSPHPPTTWKKKVHLTVVRLVQDGEYWCFLVIRPKHLLSEGR